MVVFRSCERMSDAIHLVQHFGSVLMCIFQCPLSKRYWNWKNLELEKSARRIGKIRSFLSTDAANRLAVSLILSRLDYCNSLLAGLPDNKLNKLQCIQNYAARLVLRKSKNESATTLLRTLHWLPVKARIQYKTACLCFQCIYQNSMPPYISDLLHPYCPSRTLRSLDTSLLTVPRFSLETFGKKSFCVLGPTVWNSLPLSLRKSKCFTTFKAKLKTHLFRTHLC